MAKKQKITAEMKEAAEAEILSKRKPVDYNTIEYPIEILVQKYTDGIDNDTNEIFIPDYQREMAWDEDNQSKFIESVLLGLPIPYVFVADVSDNGDSRLEIIDGTQRIRTLARFTNNELELNNLKKISSLNNFNFRDLPLSRRKRFNRTTIRMIQLTEEADEEIRRDLFERINSGSISLNEMDKRRGSHPGAFLDLIEELSKSEKFHKLCSFSEVGINKREPQEYVLRFFAFLNNYQSYPSSKTKIKKFLDNYLIKRNEELKAFSHSEQEIQEMKDEFFGMMNFVEKYFPDALHIFIKRRSDYKPATRIKFESISVGVALALRENDNLIPASTSFLESQDFKDKTGGNASSSKNKVIDRIEYVRDQLLDKS